MARREWRSTVYGVTASVAMLVSAMSSAAPSVLKLSAEQRELLDIRTVAAAPATFSRVTGLLGEVSLPVAGSSALAAPYAGVVTQVLADAGDRVSAGDVLAWINSRDVAEARARIRKATLDREQAANRARRDAGLLADGIIPAARAEQSAAELKLATAELAAARNMLGNLPASGDDAQSYPLRAPRDATVIARQIAAGESVQAFAVAFMLLSDTDLQLDFWMPVADAARVELDGVVRVAGHEARVSGREARLDAETQMIRLRARLPRVSGLLPGQRVTVDVEVAAPAGALAVPRAALVRRAGHAAVYVDRDGQLQSVPIEIVAESGDQAIVTAANGAALAAGEAVVISGLSALSAIEEQ